MYRHFGSREGLTAALADLVNERLGDLPDTFAAEELAPRMAELFASFDDHRPLMRGVLASPGGAEVRAHARALRLRRIDAALAPRLADAADPERAGTCAPRCSSSAAPPLAGACATMAAWTERRPAARWPSPSTPCSRRSETAHDTDPPPGR